MKGHFGVNFPAPDMLPSLLDVKWFEYTFYHTVKCCLCCRSKALLFLAKRYVVSAVISYTSLPHWKACCCLPPERRMLRAVPSTILDWQMKRQRGALSLRVPTRGARARARGEWVRHYRERKRNHLRLSDDFLWQPDEAGFKTEMAKKAAWGGKKEQCEWKTLKQSDKQWHKTLFKSFSAGVHQAMALKPLSACKFERKDAALKSKL